MRPPVIYLDRLDWQPFEAAMLLHRELRAAVRPLARTARSYHRELARLERLRRVGLRARVPSRPKTRGPA